MKAPPPVACQVTSPPVTGPTIVSTAAEAPGQSGWNHYLIAHRGNLHGADGDDLFAYDKDNHRLYLVENDLDPMSSDLTPWSNFPGYIAHRDADALTKPGCAPADRDADDSRCRTTNYSPTAPISQLAVVGNVFHNEQGNPSLVTVENNELWIYQTDSTGLSDPTLLGDGDWSGLTLLAPGDVNGTITLWARDNATGALYSYSLATDPATNAPPLLHAATHSSLSLTLSPAGYPFVASPGDINSAAAGGAPDHCPDLYAINPKGNLIEYPGTLSGSTCGTGFGSPVDLGTATDTATHWWNLDDGTGSTAADRNGGLNAGLSGAASWTTDSSRGKALNLTGTTGYAATAGPALDTSKSFSVSVWVKLTSTAANSTFVSQSDTSGNTNGFQLYYSSSANAWAFNRHNADNTTAADFTGVYGPPATAGKWTRLVAVYDANAGTLTLYVNGSRAAGTDWDGTTWNAAGPLQIGRRQYAGTYGEYANGEVSDVRVYNTALPIADAAAMGDSPAITQLN